MTNATDDFLLGGGGASAKFDTVGDTVTGTITTTEVKQQTDIQSGQPLTWDDGSARMQLIVKLQTQQSDHPDDDGVRAIYVKGSKKAGSRSLHDAVATAVRTAGAKGLEAGGTLTVRFDGEEPSQTRGFNPRKLYSATYAAPDKQAQTGGFLGTAPPAAQAPAPAVTPPAPAATEGPSAEELAAFTAWQKSQQQTA